MEQHPNDSAIIRYASAIFRDRTWGIGIFFAVLIPVVLYAVFADNRYGSTMKILVQNTRATTVISADPGNSNAAGLSGLGESMMEAQINSEVELLQSTDMLEGLVRYRDQLAGRPPAQTGTQRMAQELMAVQHQLDVVPIRKTNIIKVDFTDSDPTMAQKSLAFLSSAFLDKHAQLRRPAGTYDFFVAQEERAAADLAAAEKELIVFQEAHSVVSLNQEKALTVEDLHRTTTDINTLDADLSDNMSRSLGLEKQLRQINSRITTQVHDAPSEYTAERLNTLLIGLKNKRTELGTRYQPTDRLVVELDEQIATTETALDRANSRRVVETTSDNNPIRQTLEGELRDAKARLDGENARMTALRRDAHRFSDRLTALQDISVQEDALERHVHDLKQTRDTYAQKRDEASIDDQLDRQRIVDVAVAQAPTLSVQPLKPRRKLTAMLGYVAAVFAAFGFVFVKDTLRDTILTPAELEGIVAYPVLATVPHGLGVPLLPGSDAQVTLDSKGLFSNTYTGGRL